MPVRIAIPAERLAGERRVAMVPAVAAKLAAAGAQILVQKGAGKACHIPDEAYEGVTLVDDAQSLYGQADLCLKVQPPDEEEIGWMRPGTVLVGSLAPTRYPERVRAMAAGQITSIAMELIPRISRAQYMDTLSSQASAAGYQAVLIGAERSGRFFPMLTTAAGTIRPARVLVLGAGVAGLQAIATAKRLGAMVEAYDVRSATREQVLSLGAKFVDVDVKAEGEGGYARELTDEEKARQQAKLAEHICAADVVITTAAVPGRRAPILIPAAVVHKMKPGAVIVDLAAEGGGNCELTQPGEETAVGEVLICAPLNFPSLVAYDSSEMYAKNLANLLALMVDKGELAIQWEDEIVAASLVTKDGEIKNDWVREQLEGNES
ncbi:MAG: NAD(P) transhydrogenase subunit alpha [Chromatiales bacterium]|nr:NAD(P) transhydrogenase subunit alpha [Chromatiales bacterium]